MLSKVSGTKVKKVFKEEKAWAHAFETEEKGVHNRNSCLADTCKNTATLFCVTEKKNR